MEPSPGWDFLCVVAPSGLEVVVGEEGEVGVPHHQHSPPPELSDVSPPPAKTKLGANQRPVVSLLQEGRAVPVVPRLPVMAGSRNARVIEDGASEDPGGGLHQVPDPGIAGARVGDQSSGGKTVAHHEPGPVLPTLGVWLPEIVLCSILPLEGRQPSRIPGTFLTYWTNI